MLGMLFPARPPRARRLLCSLLLTLAAPAWPAADTLRGAGSSAAAVVYTTWGREYARSQEVTLQYEPVGSGAGMTRVSRREVDFGASDIPAADRDLARDDLVMVPTVVTGIVPVVQLPGVERGALRLSGELLAAIFLGEVTQWNAPEIRALNPGLRLPALPIRRVVRADSSGTSHHFSTYLSAVSPAWKSARGVASRFTWPDDVLAVKGSAAVAATVKATAGAIGYVDFNYVQEEGLSGAQLKNADGQFVSASVDAFRAAVLRSPWSESGDFSAPLVQLGGARSWPITMGTYVALPRVARDTAAATRTLRFLAWAYLQGDALAREARFVPLPPKVQAAAYRELSKVRGAAGEPLGLQVLPALMR